MPTIFTAININSFGLFLDIAGSLLLVFFGLPPRIEPEGVTLIASDGPANEDEIQKAKVYESGQNMDFRYDSWICPPINKQLHMNLSQRYGQNTYGAEK